MFTYYIVSSPLFCNVAAWPRFAHVQCVSSYYVHPFVHLQVFGKLEFTVPTAP